jgi:hypothetical protein
MSAARKADQPLQNAKHEAVLLAYVADPQHVGFRAYLSVYPQSSDAAAKTAFSRLLKIADFRARLKHLETAVTEKVVEKTSITVERVVDELAKIAFANMENYFRAGADGVPRLRIKDLSSDQMAALAEVTCEEEVEGGQDEEAEPTIVRKTKFKLYDKRAALVDILRHLGGFPASKHELAGAGGGPIQVEDKTEVSELELARRIAFTLERGARAAAGKPKKKG